MAGGECVRGKLVGDEVGEVMGGQIAQGLVGRTEDSGSDPE